AVFDYFFPLTPNLLPTRHSPTSTRKTAFTAHLFTSFVPSASPSPGQNLRAWHIPAQSSPFPFCHESSPSHPESSPAPAPPPAHSAPPPAPALFLSPDLAHPAVPPLLPPRRLFPPHSSYSEKPPQPPAQSSYRCPASAVHAPR